MKQTGQRHHVPAPSHTTVVIAHNMRSTHNVGSLLRTAEGLGVQKVYLTGYTPFPRQHNDQRLPHVADRQTRQIAKTALGAEQQAIWEHVQDPQELILKLKAEGYVVVGLEQNSRSIPLPNYQAPSKVALLLGSEVTGLDESLSKLCKEIIEIPMLGTKESFNVVQAAAMALYHLQLVNLKL